MKSKQETKQQNTYGYMTPTETPDIAAVRNTPVNTDLLDASLDRQYGLHQQELAHQHGSAFNFGVPLSLRNAQYNKNMRDLAYDKATAKAMGQYNVNQQLLNKNLAVAGMTAPQLVQTGGTSTTTQSPGLFGAMSAIGQLGMGIGAAGLKF